MKIKLRRKTKILALLLMLTMLFTSSFNSFAEINPTDLDIDTDIDEAVDSLNSEVATEEHEQKIVDQALIEDSDLNDSDKSSSSEKNDADLLSEPLATEPMADEVLENAGESKLEDSEEVDPLEEAQTDEDKKIDQTMGLDMILIGSIVSNTPSYQSSNVFSSQMKSMSTMNMLSGASNSPTSPGQVTVDKFAETVPGFVNTWDVTLRIEAMDKEVSSDIVLVIDRSGSMEGSRLTKAKEAARKFVEDLKEESNTRIAIVSYASEYDTASTVTQHTGLLNVSISSNRTDLKAAINSINALGGTNTQAGIRIAHQILAGSSADFKNIVLLSDGEPTQSYSLSSITANKFESFGGTINYDGGDWWSTPTITNRSKSTLVTSDYNYNQTVGNGSQPYTRVGSSNPNNNRVYSHGNSAIAQANIYKTYGTLWTIALETTTYGDQVLNNIATPGKAYTATETQLEEIFSEIAGSISSAAKDASVSDPMGPGFEIPAANVSGIVVSQGTFSYQNEKIDWNIGNLTTPISAGSDIRYAQLKYRIEINDDILAQTPDANGEYPTNGLTTFSYTDTHNTEQTVEFPIPKVDPVFWIVEKVLLDKNGNEFLPDSSVNPTFKVNLKSGTLYDEDWNLNIGPAANRTLITDLRAESLYTVSELNQVSAFGDIINLDPFDT
ncbi:MAG TPA: vWA domain-containing protein, partial [Candidatus Eisenbacteria bacterium]|nr:vWA domain-containing protein [Candidatus Eisenbacteria bacterium]